MKFIFRTAKIELKAWLLGAAMASLTALLCGTPVGFTRADGVSTPPTPRQIPSTVPDEATLQRWKKAVVHLECATDSQSIEKYVAHVHEVQKQFSEGKISVEQMTQSLSEGRMDLRGRGTAILLEASNRRYLISARHVIHDRERAERELREATNGHGDKADTFNRALLDYGRRRAETLVYSAIFRVPSLTELVKTRRLAPAEFIMNLGAGTYEAGAYTLSAPEIDLAIVSLDAGYSEFANELVALGHLPISLSDCGDELPVEGADVFSVGYPDAMSSLGRYELYPGFKFSASVFSLPCFSFGKVSMVSSELPFFWADVTIYPGNSGGPVVGKGKLIGIVSAQPIIPVENRSQNGSGAEPFLSTRIPFAKVIHSRFVRDLVQKQKVKDKAITPK